MSRIPEPLSKGEYEVEVRARTLRKKSIIVRGFIEEYGRA